MEGDALWSSKTGGLFSSGFVCQTSRALSSLRVGGFVLGNRRDWRGSYHVVVEGAFVSKVLPFVAWKIKRLLRGFVWVVGCVLRELEDSTSSDVSKEGAALQEELLLDLRRALGDEQQARHFGVEVPTLTHQLRLERVRRWCWDGGIERAAESRPPIRNKAISES